MPSTERHAPGERITLDTRSGAVPTEVFRPEQPGGGAVVIGIEATGPNSYIRGIARRLSALGYLVVAPDYYRGGYPGDSDDYTDLAAINQVIRDLDFRRGAGDVLAAIDWVRKQDGVDPARVATWGYCTGATFSLMAACLDRRLATSVQFYPSQPVFAALDDKHPVNVMDLLWTITAPTLIMYGEDDPLLPPDLRVELLRRFKAWNVPGEVVIYPDATHVFAGAIPERYRAGADADSWARATALLKTHLG